MAIEVVVVLGPGRCVRVLTRGTYTRPRVRWMRKSQLSSFLSKFLRQKMSFSKRFYRDRDSPQLTLDQPTFCPISVLEYKQATSMHKRFTI